jgi:hypothetical protein
MQGLRKWAAGLALVASLPSVPVRADEGRLLGTGGAPVLEGTGGGGLVPWATLSGYGSEDGSGGALALTRVRVDDYVLDVLAGSFTLWNRLELSLAQHRFDAEPFKALPLRSLIRQDMVGAKLRLFGDLIYTRSPQISVGAQLKHNRDFDLGRLVGARRATGVDAYVSGSKLILGGLFGYNLLLSGTLRASKANELGLLGFGGDRRAGYSLLPEASVALMLSHKAVIGYEYRKKPQNLHAVPEDDWRDVFFAYFFNKRLAVVGAYAQLGSIGGVRHQDGWYLSVQGSF